MILPVAILTLMFFLSGPVLAEPSLVDCAKDFVPAPGGYSFIGENEYEIGPVEKLKIGQIHYTRLQIFDESDPRENNWLYRWANRLHVTSKADVISSQILISSGQDYEPRLTEETSRLLRQRKYLYDADVRPVKVCDEKVDLEVITRDI